MLKPPNTISARLYRHFAWLIMLWLFYPVIGSAQTDLLDPEQAFQFSAKVIDPDTIEAHFKVAEGYYLYREKIKFQIASADTPTKEDVITLNAPLFPAGSIKQDEFFGRIETYRNSVKIHLPIQRTSRAAPKNIILKATSQGCADIGVCYLPMQHTLKLHLPAKKTSPNAKIGDRTLSALWSNFFYNLISSASAAEITDLLPPEQAFSVNLSVIDSNTLSADFTPAPGYYLYRDKIRAAIHTPASLRIEQLQLPPGELKADPTFGNTQVFHKPVQAVIRLSGDTRTNGNLLLSLGYQGCADAGVCYPPMQKKINLSLPLSAGDSATANSYALVRGADELQGSEQLLNSGNFWLIILGFLGAGLLLSFTPCVLPMIPILSGLIVGQGSHLKKREGLFLSLSYVIGMALTYAAVGILAGLSGTLLSTALQSPWVLGGFAMIFVALALSMFGLYELRLPAAMHTQLTHISNRFQGGNMIGVFLMGMLSAIIVSPCVAAPLAGALTYIGVTGNITLGGSALFAMAIGMGLPLIAVGASAGALLPKAARWMRAIKHFFGVLLLGVAVWLISPMISVTATMALIAALLIIGAVSLRATEPLPEGASSVIKFWKGIGVIALVTGIALLIGALTGVQDPLHPLSGLRPNTVSSPRPMPAQIASPLKFQRVKNLNELAQLLQQANGRYVMLDFYADWCVACKEMEHTTFSRSEVHDRLRDVVLLQVDVTQNTPDDKALLKRFKLFGPPGIIFFAKDGTEIKSKRIIGYQNPAQFIASLDNILI